MNPSDNIPTLLRGVVDDLKVIAQNEASLAKLEINRSLKAAAADTGAILLGAFVALIGLGLLCVSAVVALDAVIDSLATRLVLMAAVYLIVGGAVAATFARRLKTDAKPDLTVPKYEATSTVKNLKAAVQDA